MKRTSKYIVSSLGLLVTASVWLGCGSNQKKEAEQPAKEATAEAEDHGDENFASLTAEQIRTAGIAVAPVSNKQLTATLKLNGQLRVPNTSKANATSLFGGVVKSLHVELGDQVRKGQVIATISNPQFIQLQEEYYSLNSSITFAEQELQRQQELNESNVGAMKNLQNARAELGTLRTRKASLQQQITLMGINPNSISNGNMKATLTVTSPISGTVSNVFAKMGSYVDVSAPLIELVDNQAIQVELQVFEKDLPQVKIGQLLDFQLVNNPQQSYKAKLYNISSSFSGESKNILALGSILGAKTGLIEGMSIVALVSLSDAGSPAVPNDAIVNADGRYYIFVQVENEEKPHSHQAGEAHDHATEEGLRFEKFEIQKGTSDLGYTAINPLRALPKDAKVVVKGAFFVNASLSTAVHEH